MEWTRGPSSRRKLEVVWDHATTPTRPLAQRSGRGTAAVVTPLALSPRAALAHIAGDDRRPLLVLRECDECKGTDHALFEKGMHNEKTRLLVRYFHCVRLGPDVHKPDHPLHALFQTRGKTMPHVFIATADGKTRRDFSGIQAQSELRNALTLLIHRSYARRPDFASLLPAFSRLDMLDARLRELQTQQKRAAARKNADPARLKKLAQELRETATALEATNRRIDQLTALPLQTARPQKSARPRLRKPAPKLPIRKIEDFYIGHGGIRARYYVDVENRRVGAYIRFFRSGNVKQRYEYAAGVRWGAAVRYHSNGQRKVETRYENGLEHGERVEYDRNGKVTNRQRFVHGEPQG